MEINYRKLRDADDATLITMPRCWGKSLNLDMLKRFLSIDVNAETGCICTTC